MGRDRNNMSKLAKLDSIKLFFISYYVHIYALEFIYENKAEVVPSIFSLIVWTLPDCSSSCSRGISL